MCGLIGQSVPAAVEPDVCVERERNCERASDSPLLGGSAPAVRLNTNTLTNTWKRLSHSGIQGETGVYVCVCFTPPYCSIWTHVSHAVLD